MSRIGKQPVELPEKVSASFDKGVLTMKGPQGELTLDVHRDMKVTVDDGEVRVERPSDQGRHKALHGLTRSLISNMAEGVSRGFERVLEIQGVGYRAEKSGGGLKLTLGFSHTIQYDAPEGITLECPDQTTIEVSGPDKQLVGQTAAEIRSFRPPEPYKGKGIRYRGEHVRRKAGKTAVGGAGAGPGVGGK